MIQGLTSAEIRYIIQLLPVEWGKCDVSVDALDNDRFEIMLREPFMVRGRKDPYPTLEKKAALLLYILMKRMNACIASIAVLVLLEKNHRWLRVDSREFAQFALWISQSPEIAKNQAIEAAEVFLRKYVCEA